MLQPKYTDALSLYRGKNTGGELTIGIREVDDLLGGGIKPGTFTILYGPEPSFRSSGQKTSLLDLFLYRLLTNSMRYGEAPAAGSRPVLLNCGDYHNTQALLDLQLVTRLLKQNNLDPSETLNRIIVVSAYNPDQAEKAVEEVRSRLLNDPTIGPVFIREMARLFLSERQKSMVLERMQTLQHLIARLWQTCAIKRVSLILATSTSAPLRFKSDASTLQLPAGTMLKHMAQIMISLRPRNESVEARLWKHPYMKPNTVRFDDVLAAPSDPVMGRLSPAFRDQLQKEIQVLSRSFRQALLDPERREAFDSLVRAWTSEKGSMSHAAASSTIEIMLLSAIVDNRKILLNVERRLDRLESRIQDEQAKTIIH